MIGHALPNNNAWILVQASGSAIFALMQNVKNVAPIMMANVMLVE
jgi:hypothetical protein